MCDKCDNTHTSFFKNHHTIKLDKEDKIFTGFCEENDHPNKLDFFWKIIINYVVYPVYIN